MAICPNCKQSYSCSCKQRTAKDGTPCCSKCVSTYNQKLASSSTQTTSPNRVSVKYNGPGKQL